MRTNSWFPLFLRAFLRLPFPMGCFRCEKPLLLDESGLCRTCLRDLTILPEPACLTCARPLPPFKNKFKRCNECREGGRHLDRLYAVVPFDETHRLLLHEIKFHKRRWILNAYKMLISGKLKKWGSERRNVPDIIVPIPLDIIRKRQREFNQAEDLAKIISKGLDRPVARDAVGRKISRRAQSTLSRRERLKNVTGQFYIKQWKKIRNRSILLVDDIYTTGATLNECAAILRKAGAKHVSAFVLARAL